MSTNFSRLIATARPSFLILTPCCLFLALAFAISNDQICLSYLNVILVFLGAMSAHISVNMFNEYEDFCSGLDLHTQRTAFSGGSGALPAAPGLVNTVRLGAEISLALTILIGCYFVWLRDWGLAPIGVIGVMCIYFYTARITHRPLLCLLTPGLGFGPLMINGAYYVLCGQYSPAVFSASLIVFFLVNNLLLLNQFPDREADQLVGRRHLPILIGRKNAARVYVLFLVAAYALIVVNIMLDFLPLYSFLGLLTLFFAIPAATVAWLYYDEIEKLKTAMILNVAITLITPVLVGLGLILHYY